MLVLRVGKSKKKFKIIETVAYKKKGNDLTKWLSKVEMLNWIRLNTSSQVEENLVRKLK